MSEDDTVQASAADDATDIRIRSTATDEEAAAIAAAVETYLAEERAAAEEAADPGWRGRRWPLAGRLAGLSGRPARVPDGAPTDAWTAAGRVERF